MHTSFTKEDKCRGEFTTYMINVVWHMCVHVIVFRTHKGGHDVHCLQFHRQVYISVVDILRTSSPRAHKSSRVLQGDADFVFKVATGLVMVDLMKPTAPGGSALEEG